MEFDPWTQTLMAAMTSLWTTLAGFVPRLLGALAVVVVGVLVAKLVNVLFSRGLAKLGLDRVVAGAGGGKLFGRVGIKAPLSQLIGRTLYWFVLLIFLVSAAESLGLPRVSEALDVVALYVPKMFGAAVILLAGILFSQLVGTLVRNAAEGVGLEYVNGLARLVQGLVVVITVSVAIGQLEVRAELLNYVIAIALVSVGLALALAFGLGSRELVGQILSGIYVRELYDVGQRISVGEVEGVIEEVGATKTLLSTDEGDWVSVPNRDLLLQQVRSR